MGKLLLFTGSVIVGAGLVIFLVKPTPATRPTPHTAPVSVTPTGSPSVDLGQAPSQTLKATFISRAGDIEWQSRTATESSALTSDVALQQGETLTTKANGKASITFTNNTVITLESDTDLGLMQTLPQHIVVTQSGGTAAYEVGSTGDLSVRSHHLLVVLDAQSAARITHDDSYITVTVTRGGGRAAYNDTDNITQVTKLSAAMKFRYDEATRTSIVSHL